MACVCVSFSLYEGERECVCCVKAIRHNQIISFVWAYRGSIFTWTPEMCFYINFPAECSVKSACSSISIDCVKQSSSVHRTAHVLISGWAFSTSIWMENIIRNIFWISFMCVSWSVVCMCLHGLVLPDDDNNNDDGGIFRFTSYAIVGGDVIVVVYSLFRLTFVHISYPNAYFINCCEIFFFILLRYEITCE